MATEFLNGVTSQNRTVAIRSAAMPKVAGLPALEFLQVHGTERLGRLFEYEVQLRTPDDYQLPLAASANLDLKALVGKEMTLSIQIDGSGKAPDAQVRARHAGDQRDRCLGRLPASGGALQRLPRGVAPVVVAGHADQRLQDLPGQDRTRDHRRRPG